MLKTVSRVYINVESVERKLDLIVTKRLGERSSDLNDSTSVEEGGGGDRARRGLMCFESRV